MQRRRREDRSTGRGTLGQADLGRAVAALRAVTPLARGLAVAVRKLALVSLGAAAVIVGSVLGDGLPRSASSIALTVVLAAAVAAPGVVLLVFYAALTEVLELPGRLRDLPRAGREHASELARIEREARIGGRTAWARLPLVAWRAVDTLRSSAWILRPYAPLVALVSPPLLVAVVLSVVATGVLVVVALLALAAALA